MKIRLWNGGYNGEKFALEGMGFEVKTVKCYKRNRVINEESEATIVEIDKEQYNKICRSYRDAGLIVPLDFLVIDEVGDDITFCLYFQAQMGNPPHRYFVAAGFPEH